jgi:hypothetical protein
LPFAVSRYSFRIGSVKVAALAAADVRRIEERELEAGGLN